MNMENDMDKRDWVWLVMMALSIGVLIGMYL